LFSLSGQYQVSGIWLAMSHQLWAGVYTFCNAGLFLLQYSG